MANNNLVQFKNRRSSELRNFRKSVATQPIPTNVAAERCWCLRTLTGNMPMITPYSVPLDLLFFRRFFSSLLRRYGNDKAGEIPTSVFQRSVVRLFKVLGMRDLDFEAEEYDVDGSGAVGWFEFVSCWRKTQVTVTLSLGERIFLAMEEPSTCFIGQVLNIIVTMLIFVSCVLFILGTMPELRRISCDTCEPEEHEIFEVLEGICIVVFTFEFLLRAATAPFARTELLDYERILRMVSDLDGLSFPSPLVRFVHFILAPMNLIDIFVIVPFYLERTLAQGMVVSNFTVLRVLRLTRLFRLIKLGKYFEVLEIIVRVFRRSTKMLYVLGVYLVLGVCFMSAAIYYVEMGTWDPDERAYMRVVNGEASATPFLSIPHAFWWCVVTFTTVGYGDVVPVTPMGKIVASVTMVSGILVLAMPISVISMSFTEVWAEWNEERRLDAETRQSDLNSVLEALQVMDSRSHLLVELWDDLHGREEPEFLGEVEWEDLPIDSPDVETEERLMPLKPNWDKRATDKVTGSLLTSFTWQPTSTTMEGHEENEGDGPVIQGNLEVRVQSAQGLQRSDWKKAGMRDVYAVVHCWPRPPETNGSKSEKHRTATITGTLNPVWEEEMAIFGFRWPLDWRPQHHKKVNEAPPMKTRRLQSLERPDTAQEPDGLRKLVEEQGREVKALASQVAELKDILLSFRTEVWADQADLVVRPVNGLKAAGLQEATPMLPLAPIAAVPGSVEAEFDGPPPRF
mmetsp:Transcript_119411/g.333140  ORF Transcript_119411/g.333140 Transcript_119411/m.333140 type:complete len:738 (+) Transcript_119411:103-2316(+)